MRTYYYGVLGAIGGFVGWQISNLTGCPSPGMYTSGDIVVGALIGLCIGLLIGVTRRAPHAEPAAALKAGGVAALLGLVAGAIGLPLGEALFQLCGAGLIGRADRLGVLRAVSSVWRRASAAAARCGKARWAGCSAA